LRVFDITDPHLPIGFIPPQPVKRRGPQPRTKFVQQTEDVLVDTRGNIYVDDKQWACGSCATRDRTSLHPSGK
jgi:hypothetical protein